MCETAVSVSVIESSSESDQDIASDVVIDTVKPKSEALVTEETMPSFDFTKRSTNIGDIAISELKITQKS